MGMIYKRGKVWWVKYYRQGRPFYESSGSAKETDAKRLLQLREGDIVRGVPVTPQMNRCTFDELAADVVTDYQVRGLRSLDHLERRIKKHLAPFFGGRRAAAITADHVRSYILARQEAGASNGEINRELAVLKRAFTLGMQAHKVMVKPKIPKLEENSIRTGFFEREQFETVRGLLPPALRTLVTFAYITGWRTKSEILPMQWRQVDFTAGTVRLDAGTTKNNEGRVFPFTVELRALLEAQRAYTRTVERERGVTGDVNPRKFGDGDYVQSGASTQPGI